MFSEGFRVLGAAVLGVLSAFAYAVIIVRTGSWVIYFGGPDFLFTVWVYAWLAAGIAALTVLLMRWTDVSYRRCGR